MPTGPFYHGSYDPLPVGTILVNDGERYEADWSHTDFYDVLERYRPPDKLAHRDAVFMVADLDDIDVAGGATEYILTLEPLGPVSQHDLNWSSVISCLLSEGYDPESSEVIDAASNYWQGVPHPDESVWEYLTPRARVLAVGAY